VKEKYRVKVYLTLSAIVLKHARIMESEREHGDVNGRRK